MVVSTETVIPERDDTLAALMQGVGDEEPLEQDDALTASIMGGDDRFLDMISKLVAQQVDQVKESMKREAAEKEQRKTAQVSVKPGQHIPTKFDKHYRCDTSPNLRIQRLNMAAARLGQDPRKFPIPNVWIKFRLGHLYTSDKGVIEQIEWMMKNSRQNNGNRSIYEDDGSKLYKCTEGCDYITASFNGWKAHMAATHGFEFDNE